jgi:hypothetical protein
MASEWWCGTEGPIDEEFDGRGRELVRNCRSGSADSFVPGSERSIKVRWTMATVVEAAKGAAIAYNEKNWDTVKKGGCAVTARARRAGW